MAKRKPLRVVVDTNVFISFLIGRRLGGLFDAMISGDVQLVVSDQLVRELAETAREPGFRKYFTTAVLDDILYVIRESAIQLVLTPPFPAVCRDTKDDHVLALCTKGKADMLVTGDKDLLVLGKHGRTAIITPKEFGELLRAKRDHGS